MDVPVMIGQHLFTGFDGTVMAEDFCRKLRESKIGNIILFARNIGTAAQVRALCGEIQRLVLEATGQPALIAIDQEGGVVSRLGADCAVIPSAMAVSATGDPELAYRAGLLTGSELAAMGINFNLAPVLDINSNPDNPVIGARSYGSSPGQVIPPALGMAHGLREAGVLACAKHFPGHGDTAVDSHVGLPKVDKTLEQLLDCELKPFEAAIREGIPAVMSSHILFPRLEKKNLPATMSRSIMRDLLRGKLGFEGLVVSDCMMMRAIADHYGTLDGILAAIRAGVDMVFVSHSIDLAMEASSRLQQEWQAGRLDHAELEASTARILRAKAALMKTPAPPIDMVGSEEHRAIVREMYERSLTLVSQPRGGIPALGDRPLFVGCRPFAATQANSPEAGGLDFAEMLQARFGGTALHMSPDPDREEVSAIARQAAGHSSVVIGTVNAHLRQGQLEALRALARAHEKVICAALHNPYDLSGLPPQVTGIAAYAYNRESVRALIRLLAGEIKARGTLPVQLKG